jgi:acetyl-CoA carboxylase carboxyltransferase component
MGSDDSSSPAAARLAKVSEHLDAKPRRRAKKSADKDALPADYSDVLAQVEMLKKMAATPDPENRGYKRQKKAGKMWVRERVDAFVDEGSFREVGSVSGTVTWKLLSPSKEVPEKCKFAVVEKVEANQMLVIPSNNVLGFAKLQGRSVVLTVDDFSIRAGHADGALHMKTVSRCVFLASYLLTFPSTIWRNYPFLSNSPT